MNNTILIFYPVSPGPYVRVSSLLTGADYQGVITGKVLTLSPAAVFRLEMGETVECLDYSDWEQVSVN